jgi:uncharacterized protein YkwD/LysM repeat protein
MKKFLVNSLSRWAFGLCLFFLGLLPLKAAASSPSALNEQQNQITPGDLIAAVNQLRVESGLNTLSSNAILMQTAQMQANALLASEGAVGHTRPNGLSYTDQLLQMGYPLAGDLSVGGYRAENIVSAYPDITVSEVIDAWLGDSLHANTMLSPYYQDIGAGVAIAPDGTGFYVIDCAMPTASGTPQAYTPASVTSGTGGLDGVIQYIQPVTLATARPDGDVVHEVLYGQALWSIAIAYDVKIEQIQRYNNITDTTIYTGQFLLVKKGATQPPPTQETASPAPPTASRTPKPTPSLTSTPNAAPAENALAAAPGTLVPTADPAKSSRLSTSTLFFVVLVLFSILGGGLITWLEGRRKG